MYTIKQAAKKMDVSEHTLRFWCKSGVLPFIKRGMNNVRQFSEQDLDWIKIIKCLRLVGVENKEIIRYINLCFEGDCTIPERFEIIKKTKTKALLKMEELKQQLALLDYKEQYYTDLIKNNSPDDFNPVNKF